jgi:hypothetical protein
MAGKVHATVPCFTQVYAGAQGGRDLPEFPEGGVESFPRGQGEVWGGCRVGRGMREAGFREGCCSEAGSTGGG